jgi:hypothetical protein
LKHPFSEKDAPILLAAIDVLATHLLTGDFAIADLVLAKPLRAFG